MRPPIRKTFAVLLWLAALTPLAAFAWYWIEPASLFGASRALRDFAAAATWWVISGLIVLLIVYPPFLPWIQLRFRALRSRLGTDRGPLYDGLARLRHLETHVDHLQVGRLALQLEDMPRAIEHLARAHELDPRHVGGRYLLGLALERIGRHVEATALLGSVCTEDERHAFGDAIKHLGINLMHARQFEAAHGAFSRHQTLFPGNREVELLHARTLAALGRSSEASRQLQQARRAPAPGERLSPEDAFARARARVTTLRGKGIAP